MKKILKNLFATAVFSAVFFAFSASAGAATNIYYSVGQNTDSHETGSGTVIIDASTKTATFSVAQAASNMGVGDLITYVGGSCYISGKISTTIWNCQSATGTAPTAATDADVTLIAHAFASLSAAEAGAPTLLGTSDLVAGNYQLNLPCYYDSGADTTPVTVSGYTTGVNNFINIYTPNNSTTEVNNSQRHQGKWDDTKFRHEIVLSSSHQVSITITNNYVTIDGLLFSGYVPDGNDKIYRAIKSGNPTDGVVIKNNVIKLRQNNLNYGSIFGLSFTDPGVGATVHVLNNIIYASDTAANKEFCINIFGDAYGTYILSNNTVENCNSGISNSSSKIVKAFNNIAVNSNAFDFDGTFSALSFNNISSDATAPGSSALVSQSLANISFVNTTDGFEDLHLQNTSVAKGAGLNLSNDADFPFSSDIDNQNRGVIWDIGADQITPAQVFYSVGQSAADLKTGTNPTVTIAAGAAIFSEAQIGNIGVGDRVTYNTDQIAYISAKTDPDSAHWSLITATGAPAGDITDSVVVSITHEFTSLSAAVTAASNVQHINSTDLVAANVVLNLPCYYDSGADTNAVTVSGYTTGASNFIKIYTPNNTSTEANNSQRHQGKWDDGKYRLESTSTAIDARIHDIKIEGLQIKMTKNTKYAWGIRGVLAGAGSRLDTTNNIIQGVFSGTADSLFGITVQAVNAYLYARNNVISGFKNGSYIGNAGISVGGYQTKAYVSNNTVLDSYVGYDSTTEPGSVSAKNNIAQNCTDGFEGTFDAASNYNISDLASDAPGANSKNSTAVSFTDAPNKDFHLSLSDTAARNAGADLSVDANLPVTTDIDGQTRPTGANAVDIGADEAATTIYYSVGQNTTSHEAGSGTVTIDATAKTATFSVAQTATNMGVGDLITYVGGSCYISGKTSTTVWNCQSAIGSAPTAATDADVTSIAHAFNSLSAAEAGATGASYLNTSDLVAGNYQLNFPCYYDSGADTTAVIVSGYTTGALNFIKIYTPSSIVTEANNSQRHQGKWDDAKYRFETTNANYPMYMSVSAKFIRIEGLQMAMINNLSGVRGGVIHSNVTGSISDVQISNNIVKGVFSGTASSGSGIYFDHATARVKVFNNIIYGFSFGGSSAMNGMILGGDLANIYNNTVYGSYYGYKITGANGAILKNNIGNANTIDYSGVSNASSINNISSDATAPGSNAKINATVQFTDLANKDFHLASNDTAAKKSGVNLQNDPYLSFGGDIDGQGRAGNWDIGADEFAETQISSATGVQTLAAPEASKGNTNGLVGYWSFDGPTISGTTVTDLSGQNNHGTIFGAVPAMGKIGQGMEFDGVDDKIIFPALNVGTTHSATMWIDWQDNGDGVMIARDSSDDYGYVLYINNSDVYYNNGNDYVSMYHGGLIPGQWNQLAVVRSERSVLFYKNGVQLSSTQTLAPANYPLQGLKSLGSYADGDYPAKMRLDEVRIYDRALSPQEVLSLYDMGRVKVHQ